MKSSELTYTIESDSNWTRLLSVKLNADQQKDFLIAIERAESGREVRIELSQSNFIEGEDVGPQNWTWFFKKRSGESRILAAHPDSNSWVVTSALNEDGISKIKEAVLNGLGKPVFFDQVSRLNRVSNFNVALQGG